MPTMLKHELRRLHAIMAGICTSRAHRWTTKRPSTHHHNEDSIVALT